jgi:hypothetical protein
LWGGGTGGPLVFPGTYQVKLTVAGKSYTSTLEVKLDPRVTTSAEDLKKQLDLALKLRDRVSAAHDAMNELRDVRGQLEALRKRLANDPAQAEIAKAAEDLVNKLGPIEESVIQPKSKSSEDPLNYPIQVADQLMALSSTVNSADAAPTQVSYEVFEQLSKRLDEELAKWKQVKEIDLTAFNEQVQKANVPVVMVPAPKKE